MLQYIYLPNLIQLIQIPGGKLVTEGLEGVAKSDSPVIAGLAVALLVLSYIGFGIIFRYFVKKHKEELILQNEKNKEEQAINTGAQQLVIRGKEEVIKTLLTENEYLKEEKEKLSEDKNMIFKDSTDAFRQLGLKIGQLTDAQVAILGEVKQGHSDMKLFIITEIKPNK